LHLVVSMFCCCLHIPSCLIHVVVLVAAFLVEMWGL
jgi:hypothetical protein